MGKRGGSLAKGELRAWLLTPAWRCGAADGREAGMCCFDIIRTPKKLDPTSPAREGPQLHQVQEENHRESSLFMEPSERHLESSPVRPAIRAGLPRQERPQVTRGSCWTASASFTNTSPRPSLLKGTLLTEGGRVPEWPVLERLPAAGSSLLRDSYWEVPAYQHPGAQSVRGRRVCSWKNKQAESH